MKDFESLFFSRRGRGRGYIEIDVVNVGIFLSEVKFKILRIIFFVFILRVWVFKIFYLLGILIF